jgi:type IV secretory pathway TrbF-like protein
MKWEGTKTKMDPVIDDLLGNVSNAAKPKEAQQAEDTQAEAGR